MEPEHRRAVRSRLAHLLDERLERVESDRTLFELVRDPRRLSAVVERLVKDFDVTIDPRLLAGAQTVNHLVTLVSDEVRRARRDRPPATAARAPAAPARAASALEPRSRDAHPRESPIAAPSSPAPAVSSASADPSSPFGARQPRGELYASPIPYEGERIRAAAVYCSDGRIGDHVDDFLHTGLGLPRYDRLACPGGPVALAGRLSSFWECHSVEEQLRFLLRVHDVSQVVLIAHQPCAYYLQRLRVAAAELEAQQRRDLELAAWAVQRAEPTLEVAGFIAWAEGERLRFEKVLSPPGRAARAVGWRRP
jgi:hypothetical protein